MDPPFDHQQNEQTNQMIQTKTIRTSLSNVSPETDSHKSDLSVITWINYNRLVLSVLIERNESKFILIKTNFAGIAKAMANKFNAEQDKFWPMQPIKVWLNKSKKHFSILEGNLRDCGEGCPF